LSSEKKTNLKPVKAPKESPVELSIREQALIALKEMGLNGKQVELFAANAINRHNCSTVEQTINFVKSKYNLD
jgi:hypothetical protein